METLQKKKLDVSTMGFMSAKESTETIRHMLTQPEIDERREVLATDSIRLKRRSKLKSDYVKKANEEIKVINTELSTNLEALENGYIDKVMTVCCIPDDDRKVVELSKETGELVGERPRFIIRQADRTPG